MPRSAVSRRRWRRTALRVGLWAATALVVVLGVLFGRPIARGIVIIGVLSVLLAYVVLPVAERLRRRFRVGRRTRRPMGRTTAVLILYALVAVVSLLVWRGVLPRVERQLAALADSLPQRLDGLRTRFHGLEGAVSRLVPVEPVRGYTAAAIRTGTRSFEAHASSLVEEVRLSRPLVPWLALVPVIAFFLVTRWDRFRRTAVSALPEGHLRWRGDEFFAHVNFVLAGYARAQVASAGLVALGSTIGFAFIGVSYPLVLGLLAGVLELLPVIGPVTAAILAAALLDGERLFVLVVFVIGLRLVQDYVIYPRLISRGMHLHALAIILAIWAGAVVGGAAGVLVAVPFVGVAAVALRHYRDYRAIEALVRQHAGRPGEASGAPNT